MEIAIGIIIGVSSCWVLGIMAPATPEKSKAKGRK